MPTPELFNSVPPFPEDMPAASLRKIRLKGLLVSDEAESRELFGACKTDGFFLLDMRGNPEGDSLLKLAEKMFGVTNELFDEGKEELTKFTQPPPGVLGSVILFLKAKIHFRYLELQKFNLSLHIQLFI